MVIPIVIDSTLISASIAGNNKLPASSSIEYINSGSFSSLSSSSTDRYHLFTSKPNRINIFSKLFKKANLGENFANFISAALSPFFPLSPLSQKSSNKENIHKNVWKQSFGTKRYDLNKKYGVCDKGCIGKGATAIIRLAHKIDKSGCEKLYAVKEFRQRRKSETEIEYIKKLASEFCISSSLHHPNIVETVDLVKDKKGGWVEVMEYVPTDLYTVIESGRMTSAEIDCCFKQLVHGVAYMHSMGVAHRDLKPENLLLNEHGQLKIGDFGVSVVFRISWEKQARLSEGLCGSEPYIAPEEYTSNEYDAQLVDIWSIGIIYYCMTNKTFPFYVARTSDPYYAHYLDSRTTRSYSAFENMSKACRELMYGILDPDTKIRTTMAEILENDWFKSIEVCNNSRTTKGKHHHVPSMCMRSGMTTKY